MGTVLRKGDEKTEGKTVERTLAVEKAIGGQERKRDTETLKEIAISLPTASRVKIYRMDDEGVNKDYITTINAEDAPKDWHEFIKNKYSKKYGGGDYLIELRDSEGNVVHKSVISIISDKEKKDDPRKEAKYVEEALEMREQAFDKMREAQEEKSKAEKSKYDVAIDSLTRQFDVIQKMYESQIQVLNKQLEDTEDKKGRDYIQRMIEQRNYELDKEREKFEYQMHQQTEGKASTDKVYDLINTMLPMIVSKSEKERTDPIQEMERTVSLVNTITGGRKDLIESLLENPERASVFKKVMGIEENGKKDFFSDMVENPNKVQMFRSMLGIKDEEKPKDFFADMMENPQKFEMFKKLFGFDRQEQMLAAIMSKENSVPVEPPKSGFDEIVELAGKVQTAGPVLKNMLGVSSQPAKSFIELVSTFVTGAGPYLSQAVQNVMNGMITTKMIEKGLITNANQLGMQGGSGGFHGTESKKPVEHVGEFKEDTGEVFDVRTDRTSEPFASEQAKVEEQRRSMNIEQMFEQVVASVLLSSQGQPIEAQQFVGQVAQGVIDTVEKHPSLMLKVMKLGGFEGIVSKMTPIIVKTASIDEETAKQYAGYIAETVKMYYTQEQPQQ